MDEAAIREQVAKLNAAWQAYDTAKLQGDDAAVDAANEGWVQACAWLAAHGYPWQTLFYDEHTSAFSLPTSEVSTGKVFRE